MSSPTEVESVGWSGCQKPAKPLWSLLGPASSTTNMRVLTHVLRIGPKMGLQKGDSQ
jgi:hypothetical protein